MAAGLRGISAPHYTTPPSGTAATAAGMWARLSQSTHGRGDDPMSRLSPPDRRPPGPRAPWPLAAYWAGLGMGFLVCLVTSSATHVTASVGLLDSDTLAVSTRVDQGVLSSWLQPEGAPLGTLRVTKRSWGIVSTYAEELAPSPLVRGPRWNGYPIQVSFALPGSVHASAPTRRGDAVVWDRSRPGRSWRAAAPSTGRAPPCSGPWPSSPCSASLSADPSLCPPGPHGPGRAADAGGADDLTCPATAGPPLPAPLRASGGAPPSAPKEGSPMS